MKPPLREPHTRPYFIQPTPFPGYTLFVSYITTLSMVFSQGSTKVAMEQMCFRSINTHTKLVRVYFTRWGRSKKRTSLNKGSNNNVNWEFPYDWSLSHKFLVCSLLYLSLYSTKWSSLYIYFFTGLEAILKRFCQFFCFHFYVTLLKGWLINVLKSCSITSVHDKLHKIWNAKTKINEERTLSWSLPPGSLCIWEREREREKI